MIGCLAGVQAAIVHNVPVKVVQPDGDTIQLYVSGDEFYQRLHDEQGYTVVKDAEGWYVYATREWTSVSRPGGDWRLVPTHNVALRENPALAGLTPGLAESPATIERLRHKLDIPQQYRMDGYDAQGNPIDKTRAQHSDRKDGSAVTTMNNIVIFIRFSDETEITTPFSAIDSMFNDTTETGISMLNYFRHVSMGQLELPTQFFPTPQGDLVVSYQDINPRSYYMPYDSIVNTNGYQDNQRAGREFGLLQRAVAYVNQNYPVPTSINLDYNNDGLVDNVCFVIKGTFTGWSDLLWPHKWSIYDRDVRINGKRVYTFNLQLEGSGSHYFSTSTFCHEMFHTLGAPDLYHYDEYTNVTGAGIWDLMCSNTQPPQYMSLYMRMRYGKWLDSIPEISEAGTYALHSVANPLYSNQAYRIQGGDPSQWYYLEYRNNTDLFETGLPGSGLIVWRTDSRFNGNANFSPSQGIYDEVYVYRPGAYNDTTPGSQAQAFLGAHAGRPNFTVDTDPFPWLTGNVIDTTLAITNIHIEGDSLLFTYTPHRPTRPYNDTAARCTISITMSDQYGDTWNGAYLTIENLQHQPVATVALGDCKPTETREITIYNEPIRLYWDGGSYPDECSFSITLGDGTLWEPTNMEPGTWIDTIQYPCGLPTYEVIALSTDTVMGTVSGSGNYTLGETATVTATANSGYGYHFAYWTVGDDTITDNPYTFVVEHNTVCNAWFEANVGIDEAADCLTISQTGLNVSLTGAESRKVEVVDLLGRSHYRGIGSARTHITLPQAGVYLLSVEGIGTRKIVAFQ